MIILVKSINPEWADEEPVKEWLATLAKTKLYTNSLRRFSEFMEMTPQEMLDKRIQDTQSDDPSIYGYFEDRMKQYVKHLQGAGLKPSSQKAMTIAPRSFFSFYRRGLRFKQRELKFEARPDIEASIKPKFVPDNVHIRALFNSAPHLRDKVLVLVLSTTGVSPTDACRLRIESFRGLYDDQGVVSKEGAYTVKHRSKSNIPQHIFLNPELLFFMEPLLAERGYPKEGFLLETRRGNQYSGRAIRDRLSSVAPIALGEELAKEFQPKSLRDAFHNALLLAELSDDIADAFMGWQRRGSSQHYQISEVVIRSAYEKIMPRVSIDGGRQASEEIAKLKADLIKFERENKLLWETLQGIQRKQEEYDRDQVKMMAFAKSTGLISYSDNGESEEDEDEEDDDLEHIPIHPDSQPE